MCTLYQFSEITNNDIHFWFDKKLISNFNWATLPPASRAVFPVIACHRNENGLSFPGERTIAIMSGVTDKTARSGIMGLEGFPGYKMSFYTSKFGRRSKRFIIDKPPVLKGRSFPFFKSIIESGTWSKLTPTGQALYVTMRSFGFYDFQSLDESGEAEHVSTEDAFLAIYADRDFDFCNAEINLLAKYAGITRQSFYPAIKCLEFCHLVERSTTDDGESVWKVFLHTNWRFQIAHLNELTHKKFKCHDVKKVPVMM